MINCSRGDVILVNFVFSDESGAKRRPAVIISSNNYIHGRQEVIIAAITSQTDRVLFGDQPVENWRQAGLLFPSVVTGIIRTIKQEMIARKLGVMPFSEMQAVDYNLRLTLNLAF